MNVQLYNGDCLEVMDNLIADNVKVDAIITDPPFGTTACSWDSVIPFDKMWGRLNLLIKDNGAICLFGSEPFSSKLRISNLLNFRYDWIWEKPKGSGFLSAKKMPLKNHEIISVFYKNLPNYNPQMRKGFKPYICKQGKFDGYLGKNSDKEIITVNNGERYPISCLHYDLECGLHPTQKPVALLQYLIKTYTKENEIVLDFTMGSGSTGVACVSTNRNFIGIELDKDYFNIAEKRINEANTSIFDI